MKRCSVSLELGEHKLKTIIWSLAIPKEWLKPNTIPSTDKTMEEYHFHSTTGGNIKWIHHFLSNLNTDDKGKHSFTQKVRNRKKQ